MMMSEAGQSNPSPFKKTIRCRKPPAGLPQQVIAHLANEDERRTVCEDVRHYCRLFGGDADTILLDNFYVLRPNQANPYRQMYTYN